jgi:hypothetical protein
MEQQDVDRRRKESREHMELARRLAAEGMIEDALLAAFFAGIREADAQRAADEIEHKSR